MIIHYDSIQQLRQAYINHVGLPARPHRSMGGAWVGGETIADTLRLTQTGDTRLVHLAEKETSRLSQIIETPKPEWVRSPAGAFCVVPDVLAGLPAPMRKRVETQDEHGMIEIFVCTNSAAELSAKYLQQRGITILALVMALSKVRPIALYQVFTGDGNKDRTGETILTARINTTPLDLATACYVLTSAGFARNLTYELGRTLNDYSYNPPYDLNQRAQIKYELGLIKRIAIDPKRALYVGRPSLHDPVIQNPVSWLNAQINRFLHQDENEMEQAT